MDQHKRTRSMRTLLQRVSSKTDVHAQDDTASQKSEAPSPTTTTATTSSSRHPLAMESTFKAPVEAQTRSPFAPQQSTATIEQSVRVFRIYEALRNGDTAAISKAIRDTTSPRTDSEPRSSTSSFLGTSGALDGTSVLHLAVQCADVPVVEYVLSNPSASQDLNTKDKDGNTPLHVASSLSRAPVVKFLLQQKEINDSLVNFNGKTPLDLAKSPEVFQQLQLSRSLYVDEHVKKMQTMVAAGKYDEIEDLLMDEHFQSAIDVNGGELATESSTTQSGGTLLHEAARNRDHKLIQILLLNGADPFRRDRKGRLPQDVTKDDRTRAILKKSPAAAAAQRGIQEKTILGSGSAQVLAGTATGENALGGKEGREMKGYLKKWVNYTTGYKLRWFVLEDGVLSYYKHQDDAGSACRGAINMKIARLHMDPQDKLRFEIIGKSSVKYHLKANHQVEAKRWFWALNNAIRFGKDEAKEATKTQNRSSEMLRQAKLAQSQGSGSESGSHVGPASGNHAAPKSGGLLAPPNAAALERSSTRNSGVDFSADEDDGVASIDQSLVGDESHRPAHSHGTTAIEGDLDDADDYGDDTSDIEVHPVKKDAFLIAAHSARLQLDMMAQISGALQTEKGKNPSTALSNTAVSQALDSYESAMANLNGLLNDLGRIARDREAYWQYRLEQELNVRRIWEDNMLKIAQDQEELENRMGESEEKRKQAKRALREVLDGQNQMLDQTEGAKEEEIERPPSAAARSVSMTVQRRRKSTVAELKTIAAQDSEDDEDDDIEFFDAVDAGEVEVVEELPSYVDTTSPPLKAVDGSVEVVKPATGRDLAPSYKGYEDGIRKKLKMDADDRPKISLWSILKSMIGKDMTKMTLPVSFNEPTSLLQRVAEDMEYTDLLDIAADRVDPTERMLYVAAFAASEYASTIGRVAKPFNPLLGETYEYVRPDKGYRFFIEQVSHHPPIGAAWAESAKWDYYGESAVKSKFYGKSFDINPLGTWFLKLRPTAIGSDKQPIEELYTWKKVTSSVIGIITGNPTVDNYGPMEIKNHTTGEVCLLDFKPRGWKASSAFQVNGKVLDRDGNTRWSVGGRWNDKIYARLTPGFEDADVSTHFKKGTTSGNKDNVAFLVWEANGRPTGIPFNLTPFVVTLNAIPDSLRKVLPPTDTRLRPDQRAMEDGEYDFAATEKNRVEEKQRAKRRQREMAGEEFTPQWFTKGTCKVTGESFWVAKGSSEAGDRAGEVDYWRTRAEHDWSRCEDIF